MIPAANGFSWNVVSARSNARRNSLHREVGGRQPEEYQLNFVAGNPKTPEPRRKRAARQGCFERKGDPLRCQFMKACEHHASGGDRRQLHGRYQQTRSKDTFKTRENVARLYLFGFEAFVVAERVGVFSPDPAKSRKDDT